MGPNSGGQGRIRTYNVSYVADLQSVAFNQFSALVHDLIITLFIDYVNLSFRSMKVEECVLKNSNNACYAVPYYGFGRPYRVL